MFKLRMSSSELLLLIVITSPSTNSPEFKTNEFSPLLTRGEIEFPPEFVPHLPYPPLEECGAGIYERIYALARLSQPPLHPSFLRRGNI